MKSIKDYILIHIEKKSDDTFQIGEHTLFLYNGLLNFSDGSYNPNDRTRIFGTVAAIPDDLSGDYMNYSEFQLKDVQKDVKVGDKAYFYYIVLNDDNVVFLDGKMYLRVRYDSVICVVRDSVIIPVAGHVLTTPKKKVETVLLHSVEKDQELTAIVAHVPAPYIDQELGFEVGDTICYKPNSDFINTVEGVKYFTMKIEDVLAVIG